MQYIFKEQCEQILKYYSQDEIERTNSEIDTSIKYSHQVIFSPQFTGGGMDYIFLWDCSWGPYGVSSDPKKEKVNTCLCFDFDLRPVWCVTNPWLSEDWKRWFFQNVVLKRPQNHVLLVKMLLYCVPTYSSFNLRPLWGKFRHFQDN